jgi:hypothetical protein
MRFLKILLIVIFFAGSSVSRGQDNVDFTVTNLTMIGKIKFNLGDMMGQPFTAGNYVNVRGSAFLVDSFSSAVVVLNNGKAYTYDKIRLNLYTNQVHFMTPDGKEMIAGDGVVKKILFFFTPDSSRPTVYSSGYLPISGVNPYTFLEELNTGDYAIVKQISRTIVNDVGTSATPMGQHFVDQQVFFVLNKKTQQLSKWKKGAASLSAILPEESARIEQYVASQKLSCRNVQEAAEVLQSLSAHQ